MLKRLVPDVESAIQPGKVSLVVTFSEAEIEAARRLRRSGLWWEPSVGHYVYDKTGFCKQASPFQENVYFILNYPYFMRAVGGVERFKEIMLWLPTWDDLRGVIHRFGVSDVDVACFLRERKAIESGQELLALYELVESCLVKAVTTPATPRD